MNLKDLTVEQVRTELQTLISDYPDRHGTEDDLFVYYMDAEDEPIDPNSGKDPDQVVLTTPVCIIGQWIESFHPLLKENEVIKGILRRNIPLTNVDSDVHPFNSEVWGLLNRAQTAQDRYSMTWKDIIL